MTSTPTTTTAVPNDKLSDEDQIVAVTEAYWGALYASQDPPDPDLIDWEEIATPENAAARRARLEERVESGIGVSQVRPGPYVLSSEIGLVNEDLAIVLLCLRDDAFAYEVATGEVTDEASVIASKRMEIVRTGDGWRVAISEHVGSFWPDEEAECVASL